MDRRTGISGLTGMFKDSVAGVPDGARVSFAGSVAVCTPFAELLSYAVKDRGFQLTYLPKADPSKARLMRWVEDVGYSVTDERINAVKADVIVILGGLAMPKFGCSVETVESLIGRTGAEGAKIIGVCFMDIFTRSGWRDRIRFDTIINANMEVEAQLS